MRTILPPLLVLLTMLAASAGTIDSVVGTGEKGHSGDGGQATKAELSQPIGVAANAAGNLLIADLQNARIRMVTG